MPELTPNLNPLSPPVNDRSRDSPPAILLMGDAGTGKTTSLWTLLDLGLEVNIITTEPHGLNALLEVIENKNPSLMEKLHWKVVPPAPTSWKALTDLGTLISKNDFGQIAEAKKGFGKEHTLRFNEFILATSEFKCDRTGETLGDLTERGSKSVFVIDSLSGFSSICYQQTIGYKPSPAPGEWNIMQHLVESYLHAVTSNRNCYFVLIAHTEMEVNEVTGTKNQMVSTLGRKLAPKIPKMFNEVVLAKREGIEFSWSTAERNTVLRTAYLPISGKLLPSFAPCVQAYERKMTALNK